MTYTEKTSPYNEKRYGKPWMAIVTTSLTANFTFLDWDGRWGQAGEFSFDAEPGTLLAYGQKDIRKGRGGVDGYQICMPDGSLPTCSGMAAELRKMTPEARWRKVAQKLLDKALTPPPATSWNYAAWAETRNEKAERYSVMLGIANPITAVIADALGLIDHPTVEVPQAVEIDVSAFGI
jgi:hypothetical protein